MKIKVCIFMALAVFFSLFYFSATDKVFAKSVLEEFTSPRRILYEYGVWTFEFDLKANVAGNGETTASTSGLRPSHSSAWSSLTLTTDVTKVKKSSDRISVFVEIRIKGNARRFSAPLETADKPGTWTWTEGSKEPFTDTIKEIVILPFDKYPEFGKIENLHPGSPATTSLGDEPVPVKPEIPEEPEVRIFINEVKGEVLVKKPGGNWIKAEKGMDLEVGDRVKALSYGRAAVEFSNRALIKIKPDTEFVIPVNEENLHKKYNFFELVHGALFIYAQKDKDPLKIATPNAICGLRGTEFEITFKNGITRVNVIEGIVWLRDKSQTGEIVIKAGESASIPKNAETPQFPAGEALDISGKWKTNFGTVTFVQSRSTVTGSYPHDSGKIEARLQGNTLSGKWSESPSYKPPKDAGDIEFIFSGDGKSFEGKWRYGYGKNTWDGSWKGNRIE